MARLTWDNVAAPNFSGVADSYRVMSQLLGNATKSGLDMIDTIKNTNAEAADRAILQRIAGVQDPAQFDAASIIGGDGSNASLRTLGMVADRPEALLRNAVTREGLNWDQYGHQRTIEGNAILDAPENRDKVNLARSLAAIGRGGEAVSTLSSIPGLRADQYANVLGDIDTMSTRALARDVTGQRLTEDRFDFGNKQQDDATRREANQLAQTLWAQSYDGPSALRTFGRLTEGKDPRTVAALRNVMSSIYPEFGFGGAGGGGGSVASSGSNSAGATAGLSNWASQIPFDETRNYVKNIMSNVGTLSGSNREKAQQLLPALIQQESGGRDNAVSSAGARGRTQVMPATGADPGFGVKPMQNQSPQEYERFATDYLTAMLDRYGGDPEKALAAYNAGAGRVDQWQGQIVSAVNPQVTNNLVRDVARADDQSNVGNVGERLAERLGQRRRPADVAKELVQQFPGVDEVAMDRLIQSVMSNQNINADQAAELILQNRGAMERDSFFNLRGATSAFNPLTWLGLTGRFDLDPDVAGRGGAQAVDSMLRTAANNEERATLVQNRSLVDNQILDREARINALNARIEALGGNPGLEAELKRVQTQRDQLKKISDALQSFQENNQNTTSGRVPTTEDRMVAQIRQYLQNRPISNNGGQQDLDTMLKIAAMLPN